MAAGSAEIPSAPETKPEENEGKQKGTAAGLKGGGGKPKDKVCVSLGVDRCFHIT